MTLTPCLTHHTHAHAQVTHAEFESGLASINANLTSSETLELFHALDAESKGYITRKELGSSVKPHLQDKKKNKQKRPSSSPLSLAAIYNGGGEGGQQATSPRKSSDYFITQGHDEAGGAGSFPRSPLPPTDED